MFIMDVPYVPAQETPIVLAQAAAPSAAAAPRPDYLLTDCQQIESTGPSWSAGRAVDPAGLLKIYMQNKYNRPVDFSAIKNVTLLESTTVGKITSVIDNTGRSWYRYDPPEGYEGKDQAVFMAEFEGKRYKIVVNIVVSPTVGESPLMEGEEPVCPPPKLIKVKGKPVSGSTTYDSSYSLGSLSVTFAGLAGSAVGQTTGSTITLDTKPLAMAGSSTACPGTTRIPPHRSDEDLGFAGQAERLSLRHGVSR